MNRRRPTRHSDTRPSRTTVQPSLAAIVDGNASPPGDGGSPDSGNSCPAPDAPVITDTGCDVSAF
ncbi:hypothetical protein [Amycolatopsis decaplanina]|uniref:Uncharacterized protein n=1 Tax=Amycolatopsis decaplanina DSM 44594 TaxID=1284240 RepID=M2ZYR4_9PSEU|nr:hypothetical protein [Amycolatopsis decaplanina]EME65858.1 hypothetical protein H074_00050 [Amycolatopsis decaplanina DSM 44594]